METFSALLDICAGNSPVPGEFPTQRPVTQSFNVFFDLRLNKRLSKQSWGWWFETLSRPLWRHLMSPLGRMRPSSGHNVERCMSLPLTSLKMIKGLFPPSSKETRFRFVRPAACITNLPTCQKHLRGLFQMKIYQMYYMYVHKSVGEVRILDDSTKKQSHYTKLGTNTQLLYVFIKMLGWFSHSTKNVFMVIASINWQLWIYANLGGSREGDLVYIHMFCDGSSRGGTVTRQHIDHACRETRLENVTVGWIQFSKYLKYKTTVFKL